MIRLARILSVLVLTVPMAALPARAADVDPRTPSDTEAVVHVNLRQILDSALVKKYALDRMKDAMKNSTEAQQFMTATGLDPLKDLSGVTVTLAAEAVEGKMLVLLHGSYDLEKMDKALAQFAAQKPAELKVMKAEGMTIYEAKNDQSEQPMYATFFDKGTLALSPSKDYLVASSKKGAAPKKALQDLCGMVDDKQSVWMVGTIPPALQMLMASNPQTADVAKKLQALTGNVAITDAIQTTLRVHTTDTDGAKEVQTLLDGVKGILTFAVQGNPDVGELLGDVVKNIEIKTKDKSVEVSAKVDSKTIEAAVKKIPN